MPYTDEVLTINLDGCEGQNILSNVGIWPTYTNKDGNMYVSASLIGKWIDWQDELPEKIRLVVTKERRGRDERIRIDPAYDGDVWGMDDDKPWSRFYQRTFLGTLPCTYLDLPPGDYYMTIEEVVV